MKKKIFLSCLFFIVTISVLNAKIIKVPKQYSTITEAYLASSNGDTILIANGTYELTELFKINKAITIASEYIYTKKEADINSTIIKPANSEMHEWFEIAANDAYVIGLKFVGNKHHTLNITAEYAYVTHCKFFGGNDQLSFSGGGGYVGYCYFENAGDDALDCDNSITWTIEHNTIVNAYQDGIEIRLHPKKAPLTIHNFRYNTVISAGQSGIQLIDYKKDSYREFYINNNIFQNCEGAGVSCMYKEKDNTNEVYKGSLMEETAFVYNNTFVGCNYGLTISPGLLVLNNIFIDSKTTAIGRGIYVNDQNDKSIVDYSLFYNNITDFDKGIVLGDNNLFKTNPLLNEEFDLTFGSSCIEKGILTYEWKGKKFDVSHRIFEGKTLDLGALEFGTYNTNLKQQPIINIGKDIVIISPKKETILKSSVSGIDPKNPLSYNWKKLNGIGEVKFSDPNKLQTTVSFSEEGIYDIMLTGSNNEHSTSDVVTVYFVSDFINRTITVGDNKGTYVEAEDYRYLVGSANVVSLLGEDVIEMKDDRIPSYSQYQVSTATSGTYYVWVRLNGSNGKLIISLNDLKDKKEIYVPNNTSDFVWIKAKFTKIPEGLYPLRIRTTKNIVWDKIFITNDNSKNPNEIIKEKPPITPKWALGHIVWEDSINTQIAATKLVKDYKENKIPVNGIIIDSPWSLSYNDFNWDKTKYPNPTKMIQDFNSQNIKVILWLTGCINSSARDVPVQLHPDFKFAKEKGYTINNGAESEWWKGVGMHLDFTNKEAVKWWNKKLDKVFDDGVCGWKVDQGEQTFGDDKDSVITSVGKMALRDFKFYYYDSMFDYATSKKKDGMILARPFSHQGGMASRISKVSVGWSGDFSGDWSGLKLQINNIYTSAKAGYGALACEVGGFFRKHAKKEEFIRYAQFGSMCATMVNGGANGALTNHLPWYHDEETTKIYRYYVNLHYELRNYIFSELVNAHQDGGSLMKDVSFQEESHKLGNNIFFKAITSDTNKVTFTLPKEGNWIDFWTDEKYESGMEITKEYSLDKAPIFVRDGAIIPLEINNSITGIGDETFDGKITILIYPNKESNQYIYHKPLGDGIKYRDIEITYNNGKISVKSKEEESYIFLIKNNETKNGILKIEKIGKDFIFDI